MSQMTVCSYIFKDNNSTALTSEVGFHWLDVHECYLYNSLAFCKAISFVATSGV